MDELVNLVVEKTGLPKETAKQATETVLTYLKDKLPPPLAGQIDALLAGKGGGLDDLARGALGGLFGKK